MSGLFETLQRFAEACNRNQRLQQMNHDWDRLILVQPDDADEEHWIRYRDGVAVVVAGAGDPDPADLIVEGASEVLVRIFSGDSTPTEPYMSGDLRVRGSQDDVMRLDIIALLIWGE